MFFTKLKSDVLGCTDIIVGQYPKLSATKKLEVYKWHNLDDIFKFIDFYLVILISPHIINSIIL